MGNSTRRRSDAHSGAARSTAASRPHCADHWRELSAESQAQSGINQGSEESVRGPGVGQFYFGGFGPGWVKIQSALTGTCPRSPKLVTDEPGGAALSTAAQYHARRSEWPASCAWLRSALPATREDQPIALANQLRSESG